MGPTAEVNGDAWDRRRLLAVLGGVVAAATVLVVGLGYAVYFAVGSAASPANEPTGTAYRADPPARDAPGPAPAQARRDEIAARPMLSVRPEDSHPTAPAAVAGPSITVPAAATVGPAAVPSGFPHAPEGAIGQLAAIEMTVLQAMSIPQANGVYRQWAMPGGVGVARWELTRNVQAFLGTAQMGNQKDITTTVVATPAGAQVKGVDGPDWVVACVLLDVRATITTDARMGYGYCERMQWNGDRWMIAPGAPPAKAPSTWPGSEPSVQAGWRTWVDGNRE